MRTLNLYEQRLYMLLLTASETTTNFMKTYHYQMV